MFVPEIVSVARPVLDSVLDTMPKDVLARDVQVRELRAGDVLVFDRAGAYGWDISHHDFLSHPHPEHVFLVGAHPA